MENVESITVTALDPERQKRAKEYSRINRRLMVVDLLITAIYFLAWLVLGWSQALSVRLSQITSNEWLLVFIYVLVVGAILFVINLPLSYYQGFILPHRYELSTQTLAGWITDQLKGIMVGGVLGLIVLEIIYAVLRAYPTYWWLITAAILLLFNVILANLAPTVLMPLFNKFVPLGEEHAELAERLASVGEALGHLRARCVHL